MIITYGARYAREWLAGLMSRSEELFARAKRGVARRCAFTGAFVQAASAARHAS